MHQQLWIARKEKRLNQKDVAAVLKLHPHTYHLKESGKADFTLIEGIILASYFDRSLDSLFGDKKEVKQ